MWLLSIPSYCLKGKFLQCQWRLKNWPQQLVFWELMMLLRWVLSLQISKNLFSFSEPVNRKKRWIIRQRTRLLLLDIVEAQLHNTVAAFGNFLSIAQADFYPSEWFRGNHGLLQFRRWSHHMVVGDKEGDCNSRVLELDWGQWTFSPRIPTGDIDICS